MITRLLATYALLQSLDAVVTVYGVEAGLLAEANPLMQPTSPMHLMLKIAVIALTTYFLWYAYRRSNVANSQISVSIVKVTVVCLTAWYAFVVANNFFALFF